MKTIVGTLIWAALSAALVTQASAQDVTLRMQHFISPKGAIPSYFIAPWAEKVRSPIERAHQGRNLPGDATWWYAADDL